MDIKTKIDHLAQSGEDRVLLSKVYEKLSRAQGNNIPANSCFLSLREQDLTLRLMGQDGLRFFGGYDGAERAVACHIPDYLELESLYEDDGPIVCLRATFFEKDKLTHRDFLGSLMGCGVKRETVGDICVGVGSCDFFVLKEIAPYIEQNLISAGRVKLHVERISLREAKIPVPDIVIRRDTLASLRLDSVISSGFRISRGQATGHVQSGVVSVDGLPVTKPDKQLAEGAVVSLRGMGKIRLAHVNGQTKKGRISVEIEKFI